MSNVIKRVKAKAYLRTVKALKYRPKRVLREKRIGNCIVTVEMARGGVSKFYKIYNADTLEEYYRCSQTASCYYEDTSEDIKVFYQRCEDRIFNDICNLASRWQNIK